MNKRIAIALAPVFTAMAVSASADPAAVFEPYTADKCVNDFFNRHMDIAEKEPTRTLHFKDGFLEDMVAQCEEMTQTKADFYKGMIEYSQTLNGTGLKFE